MLFNILFILGLFFVSFLLWIFGNKHNAQSSASEAHYRTQLDFYLKEVNRLSQEEAQNFNLVQELKTELAELKSQQQSKSVRLGQLSEAVLPFHQSFPYDPKKLVPMFRPIDYIFFGDSEIVFVELKLGTSQLTQKQKNIRRLIQEGKVRFDLIEATESGIKSKESHGKKANA
jgi:predicted Holliday junction resolvase-like endonuclease